MNRHQRRAAVKRARERERAILKAVDYLANVADRTVIGATVIAPDGEMTYLDAQVARGLRGDELPRGQSS